MKRKYFIAGTDSKVGKTFISVALLNAFAAEGFTTLGLKPIATGSELVDGEQKNADAALLTQASSLQVTYPQTNPLLFDAATSPYFAAARENKKISASTVTGYVRGTLMTASAQITLIEGAGGWREPLNYRETYADVVKQLNVDVILVVAIGPGCLNHALLTADAIKRDGRKLVGWVANSIEPSFAEFHESVEALCAMMHVPLIAVMPYLSSSEKTPKSWLNPHFLSLNE